MTRVSAYDVLFLYQARAKTGVLTKGEVVRTPVSFCFRTLFPHFVSAQADGQTHGRGTSASAKGICTTVGLGPITTSFAGTSVV